MKKIKSMQEVLDNLILTDEERKLLAAWVPYLDQDQYAELIDDAWQAGSAEYLAEQAYEKLLPIFARAIDRTLRSNEDVEDAKLITAEEKVQSVAAGAQ